MLVQMHSPNYINHLDKSTYKLFYNCKQYLHIYLPNRLDLFEHTFVVLPYRNLETKKNNFQSDWFIEMN